MKKLFKRLSYIFLFVASMFFIVSCGGNVPTALPTTQGGVSTNGTNSSSTNKPQDASGTSQGSMNNETTTTVEKVLTPEEKIDKVLSGLKDVKALDGVGKMVRPLPDNKSYIYGAKLQATFEENPTAMLMLSVENDEWHEVIEYIINKDEIIMGETKSQNNNIYDIGIEIVPLNTEAEEAVSFVNEEIIDQALILVKNIDKINIPSLKTLAIQIYRNLITIDEANSTVSINNKTLETCYEALKSGTIIDGIKVLAGENAMDLVKATINEVYSYKVSDLVALCDEIGLDFSALKELFAGSDINSFEALLNYIFNNKITVGEFLNDMIGKNADELYQFAYDFCNVNLFEMIFGPNYLENSQYVYIIDSIKDMLKVTISLKYDEEFKPLSLDITAPDSLIEKMTGWEGMKLEKLSFDFVIEDSIEDEMLSLAEYNKLKTLECKLKAPCNGVTEIKDGDKLKKLTISPEVKYADPYNVYDYFIISDEITVDLADIATIDFYDETYTIGFRANKEFALSMKDYSYYSGYEIYDDSFEFQATIENDVLLISIEAAKTYEFKLASPCEGVTEIKDGDKLVELSIAPNITFKGDTSGAYFSDMYDYYTIMGETPMILDLNEIVGIDKYNDTYKFRFMANDYHEIVSGIKYDDYNNSTNYVNYLYVKVVFDENNVGLITFEKFITE